MGDAAPQKYRAVFDDEKIGRSGGPPAHPLGLKTEPPDLGDATLIRDLDQAVLVEVDRIADEVVTYARRFCRSSDVYAVVHEAPGIEGGTRWRGAVYVGLGRVVGRFTIVSD